MKKIFLGSMMALLACAAFLAWRFLGPAGEGALPATVAVARGDIEEAVTAPAALQPLEYVDAGAQVSGQIKTLRVAPGDRVTRGELLAEIDGRLLEARLVANRAQLDSLRAQLAEKRMQQQLFDRQLKRNENLVGRRAASEAELERSASAGDLGQGTRQRNRNAVSGACVAERKIFQPSAARHRP